MGLDGDRVHLRPTEQAGVRATPNAAGALTAPGRPAASHEDITRTWMGPRDPGAALRRRGPRSAPVSARIPPRPPRWATPPHGPPTCAECHPSPTRTASGTVRTARSVLVFVVCSGRSWKDPLLGPPSGVAPWRCLGPGWSLNKRPLDRAPAPSVLLWGSPMFVCFACAVFAQCPRNVSLSPALLEQKGEGGG